MASAPKSVPKYLDIMFEFYDDKYKTDSTSMLKKIKTSWPEFAQKFAAPPKPKKKPDTVKQLKKATDQLKQEAKETKDENYLAQLSDAVCQQMNSLPNDLKEKVKTMLGTSPVKSTSVDNSLLEQLTKDYEAIQEDIKGLEIDQDQQESLSKAVETLYQDMVQVFEKPLDENEPEDDIDDDDDETLDEEPAPKRRRHEDEDN